MNKKFYQNGLNFTCMECGECCRLPEGRVDIIPDEVSAISVYLGIKEEEFLKQYCAIAEEKVELRENAQKECIFLEDNRCIIYPVRPLQCRTFPFWPENLKSHFRWSQLKQFCRGIDQGKHHSIEKIEEKRIKQKRYDKKLKYSWLEKIEKPYIQS